MNERPAVRGLARGQGCALAGAGLGAMAVFVLPLLLGPVGMVFGAAAWLRGEPRGRWVIVAAAVGTVLGLLLNLLPEGFVMN